MFDKVEIILLCILIVIAFWNARSWHILMKHSKQKFSGLPDARYYELKFHNQLLVGLSTILIAAIGFFGFNSLDTAKTELKKSFQNSLDSLDLKLETFKSSAEQVEGSLNRKDELEAIVKRLGNEVNDIQKKNILQQSYYIISRIPYHPGMDRQTTMYFDKLPTLNGRLPKFKKPPIIIAVPDEHVLVKTFNVTSESFDVRPDSSHLDQDKIENDIWRMPYIYFTLLIFERQ